MTNLQPAAKKTGFELTPERALLLLPVASGVLIAALLVVVGLVPLLAKLKEQNALVRTYQDQAGQIPMMRSQQLKSRQRLEEVQAKEQKLLALVSNVEQLDTLLTVLNQLARINNVSIVSVEPEKVEAAATDPAASAAAPAAPAADPAAAAAPAQDARFLRRHYGLTVEGGFVNLLNFFRQVESLSTAILIKDLEITGAQGGGGSTQGPSGASASQQTVKMRLTAYQRKPPEAPAEAATPDPAAAVPTP